MIRGYWTALKGFLDRRTPGYLIFFVTPYCNCRCKMCFNADVMEHAGERNVLRLDEIERVARNFPGLHHVNFSGGEPFLRKDFEAIPGLFYAHSGTRFFTCPTNSSLPEHTEAAVDAICRQCPDAWIRITQSLDGVGALHDSIRGRTGLFDCVVELNQRLAKLRERHKNLSVGIASVLSKFNEGHEAELIDYVYDHLAFNDFGFLYVRGQTRDVEARSVARDAYRRFQQQCIQRARTHPARRGLGGGFFAAINHTAAAYLQEIVEQDHYVTPCLAGKRMVVMDDEGAIEPCEILKVFVAEGKAGLAASGMGNIRDFDYDIRKVLATEEARRITAYIKASKCYCTFECAMAVNVLYTARIWPRVLANFLRMHR
jgi:MoaA/NifB/PqqE/SkfB family radical SAM enzyme